MMRNAIIELKGKGLLFSFPSLTHNTHYAIKYDVQNSGKVDIDNYEICSGHSIIFSQVSSYNSLLESTIIHKKTNINELLKYSYNHFFIVNTNLHSLPPNCCGALIAYSHIGSKDATRDTKSLGLTWQLGILCYHSLKVTVIVPTYLYQNTNTHESRPSVYLKNDNFVLFDNYNYKVSIKYLNHISILNNTVDERNLIHMKIEGPDVITKFPYTSKQRKMYARYRNNIINTTQGLGVKYTIPFSQYNSLFLSQVSNKKNSKHSLCHQGCTIINIECPKQSLCLYKDSKFFLVPYDVSNDGFDSLHKMTYVFLNKESLHQLLSFESVSIKEYLSFLDNHKQGDHISLKIIDPKKINQK